ncbi:MAG TPA: gephyrin-like molybdotransferase Glp [Gaiellaceae bacterium]|nr:gephyrin-like molybdotransferase Glp [Gaiellaceae bacterium]
MQEPIPIEQARALVLERTRPLPAERVPLAEAAGRVLAEDARSAVDLPPFASSAMDGFALRAADAPGTLPIVARIAAGRPATAALREGQAMEISTGGVVPEGADAVIPVEYVVEHDNESVEIASDVEPGANVRPRGGDVSAGDLVARAGTLVGPAQLGALAAAGVAELACARRPRAAVLTTGTELRAPGEPLGPGEVYEANSLIVAAQLAAAGAVVERLAPVVDDEDAHREAIARGLESDILITTGGVSVGPHDLVRRIEAELGVEEVFWRIAVRPGKPVAFGLRRDTLVFGLPGNPVSSLVGFELFVRPAVHALQGLAEPGPNFLPGRLGREQRRNPGRDNLVRAHMQSGGDEVVLEPLSGQDSHMIVRAAAADALVLVPRGEGVLEAGAPVRYLRLA